MRKLIVLSFLLCSLFAFSQETQSQDFKRNELKGNALFLVLGSFEFSYERILNEESGVGIAVNLPFDSDNWDINYTFTGYYRYYFGKKPASGFFGEAFGMLNNVDDYVTDEPDYYYEQKTLTDFALGIGLGGKWVTKKGLLLEINTGIGRNLFNNQYDDRDYELIGRAGITVGYRF
ncbi:DUF3575 domain-containing protein [Flavobacterium sp. RSB2_4_14]|uniref:DUF3575 domain-containing protein n=1 Tax=Flavobacterium sp. RSB2_4_14 TaxID=3447665 RepID=UPI003F2DD952